MAAPGLGCVDGSIRHGHGTGRRGLVDHCRPGGGQPRAIGGAALRAAAHRRSSRRFRRGAAGSGHASGGAVSICNCTSVVCGSPPKRAARIASFSTCHVICRGMTSNWRQSSPPLMASRAAIPECSPPAARGGTAPMARHAPRGKTRLTCGRFDVVASHFALYASAVLDQLRGVPHVVHFHGPWAAESRAEGAGQCSCATKWAIERLVYGSADRIIVLSHALGGGRAHLRRQSGAHQSRARRRRSRAIRGRPGSVNSRAASSACRSSGRSS